MDRFTVRVQARFESAHFLRSYRGPAEPLQLASGVLIALALFPGLPKIPFLTLGVGLGAPLLSVERPEGAPRSQRRTGTRMTPCMKAGQRSLCQRLSPKGRQLVLPSVRSQETRPTWLHLSPHFAVHLEPLICS